MGLNNANLSDKYLKQDSTFILIYIIKYNNEYDI